MEYVVIRSFTDKNSQIHYAVGDRFPHRGFASKARVAELSSTNNKRGVALIAKKDAEKETEKEIEKEIETAEPVVEDIPEPVYYTKADITTMTVAKLRKLAKENGVKNTDGMSGAKLKEILIEKMGL